VPLRALGGTALVTVIAWGAYEWASSAGHGTIGMIAGILLVPAGLALAGLLAVTLTALARRAAAAIADEIAAMSAPKVAIPTARGMSSMPPTPSAAPRPATADVGGRRIRFCPQCGTRAPAMGNFCGECGTALRTERAASRAS